MIIEGDILVPVDFFESDACYATNFWTDGIIPFEFHPNVSQANQDTAILAMAEWEAVANVDFIPRDGHSDYIQFYSSDRNASSVGMQGGMQLIHIFNWGWRFIIAHEICHALGFWHEQSRANRDEFIQVNLECIEDDAEPNFDKHSDAGHYGYYDFISVMHYPDWAFYDPTDPDCTEPYSITVLPPNEAYQSLIGQRDSLTYLDRITMSFVYPEANWMFVDYTNYGNEYGTFQDPFETFLMGIMATPPGGTLWVQPGTYIGPGALNKEMIIKAPLGDVIIQ